MLPGAAFYIAPAYGSPLCSSECSCSAEHFPQVLDICWRRMLIVRRDQAECHSRATATSVQGVPVGFLEHRYTLTFVPLKDAFSCVFSRTPMGMIDY